MSPTDITKTLADFNSMYTEADEERGHNFLVYGAMGTGKTRLVRTCRRPVLVHSFDPGGTTTIRDLLRDKESGVVADTRFEVEDAKKPTAWSLWEKEVTRLEREETFPQLGTYVIDSLTMWSEALMNEILKKRGRANGVPQLADYNVLIATVRDEMKHLAGLDCDILATGHIDMDKDDVTGRLTTTVMITGKLKVKIPLLFDEIYVAQAKQTKDGSEYSLLTRPDGTAHARTRLGAEGKFDMYEQPNIKYLLEKAGEDASDKPF